MSRLTVVGAIVGPDVPSSDRRRHRRRSLVRLPPGQKWLDRFPRFGQSMTRPAPKVPDQPVIEFRGVGIEPFDVPLIDLLRSDRREVICDFHCVAGWSTAHVRWEGVQFNTIYRETVVPALAAGTVVTHLLFAGLDGWRSVLTLDDAMSDTVLVADRLNGDELGSDHGAPARLVSPNQYGYLSTKHLGRIELHASEPSLPRPSLLDRLFVPHPRARVWHEERHRVLPSWLVRPLYRSLERPLLRLSARGPFCLGTDAPVPPGRTASRFRLSRWGRSVIPDPPWPAPVLAAVQLADAVFCAIPPSFVTRCLDDVGLPPRYRALLAPFKLAAAGGLVAGLWVHGVGAVTAAAVAAYFVLAVAAHLRVRDIGLNMFNASVILAFSVFTFATYL
jgi:DMSO/TMAO reductase YedYZ molybdopterin-dependent catalytic subunit